MASDPSLILYVALGFALISIYVALRTVLPLLPRHHLARRSSISGAEPYLSSTAVDKRPRLKSAQRFTIWLSSIDILAACVLLWETAMVGSGEISLGGSSSGASRIFFCSTARPTLLLVVAILSYANVVQGRSISLGRWDWIVWLPASILLVLGCSLATLSSPGSPSIWIGLLVWLIAITLVVVFCFGRLLIAILRVRRSTVNQDDIRARSSSTNLSNEYLPSIRSNFSEISASFISTIGRNRQDRSFPDDERPSFTQSEIRAVEVDNNESQISISRYDPRSPTPGSSSNLLAQLYDQDPFAPTTPMSALSPTPPHNANDLISTTPDHVTLSFETLPRPSVGSYNSVSSYSLAPGGYIGRSATREAMKNAIWGNTAQPGSGSSPIQLSQKEARSALIRLGGHLISALLSFSFISPFLFTNFIDKSASSSSLTIPSILLIIGICQPSIVLAIQSYLSEGAWYKLELPRVLSSTSIFQIQTQNRPSISTHRSSRRSEVVPRVSSTDCDEVPKGRLGRVLSMAQAHPKLLILPSQEFEATTTSYSAKKKSSSSSNGHTRLRSLNLAKGSIISATITTSSVHEQRHRTSASLNQILSKHHSVPSTSFKRSGGSQSSRSHTVKSTSTILPFGFRNKESAEYKTRRHLTLPASPPPLPPKPTTSILSTPSDYRIDFLSSLVLPTLVPGVKIGGNTTVDSDKVPIRRRRNSLGNLPYSRSADSLTSNGLLSSNNLSSSGKNKNYRNLSLPGVLRNARNIGEWPNFSRERRESDAWIEVEVEDGSDVGELGQIEIPVEIVNNDRRERIARRQSWKAKTLRAWEELDKRSLGSKGNLNEKDNPSTLVEQSQAGAQLSDTFKITNQYAKSSVWNEKNEYEGQNESEILDDQIDFADESAIEDDEEIYRQVPIDQNTQVNLVPHRYRLRSSGTIDEEATEIRCATVRPISRHSDTSSTSETSHYSLRPSHRTARESISSDSSSRFSSITSRGFQNLLESGTWHANRISSMNTDEDPSHSSASEEETPRRSSVSLRNSLPLGEIDFNSFSQDAFSSDGEVNLKSINKVRKSGSRQSNGKIPYSIAPPPVPSTISEDEELDKRSGSPTPRASRYRPRYRSRTAQAEETRTSMLQYVPNLDGPTLTQLSTASTTDSSTTTTSTSEQLSAIASSPRYKSRDRNNVRRSVRNVVGDPNKTDSPLRKMR